MQSNPKAGKDKKGYNVSRKLSTNRYHLQVAAEVAAPEHQMGFCRMLAGIYTHTSGHITGAPMAHWNAINESRFKFSHEVWYLPVHGLEGILKKEKVIMRFRNMNGKQVGFHKALNYLYRPLAMEHMSAHEFYSETEYINISQARKDGIEYFEYTEKHLFHATEAVIYRTKTKAVLRFPWNWLSSTRSFRTSILNPTNENAIDHSKKEEYAFRFMLLFVPFRSIEDMKTDGCYQKAFQKAHKEDRVSDAMIQIAENIQTIHNSLASSIPENPLSAETTLVESGDFENTNADDDKDDHDDLLANIGELFGSMTQGDQLEEESRILDIQYGNKKMEETIASTTELETVIEFSNDEDNHGDTQQKQYGPERFFSTIKDLNMLSMTTTITRSQANDGLSNTENEIINANGTWQSIAKWGENEGLDGEQQTAFEILAATYVLSFYDDAIVEPANTEKYPEFVERRTGLSKLARQNTNKETPLCMFITGPAGAGKCK